MTDATRQWYHRPIKHFANLVVKASVVTLCNNSERQTEARKFDVSDYVQWKIPQQVKNTSKAAISHF